MHSDSPQQALQNINNQQQQSTTMKRGIGRMSAPHYTNDGRPKLHDFRPAKENCEPREKAGGRWLVKECCGIITVIFVYFLILWPVYFVGFVLSANWSLYARVPVMIFFIIFAIGGLWSHTKCMTTNPGTVPLRSFGADYPLPDETLLSEAEGMRYCQKCDGPKPPKAHHCSTCNRCILKMDHHCPWMNNCIGMYNLKFFMLFLAYIALQSFTALGAIGGTFGTCHYSSTDKNLRTMDVQPQPQVDDISDSSVIKRMLQEINIDHDPNLAIDDGIELVQQIVVGRLGEQGSGRRRKKRTSKSTRNDFPKEVCGLQPHNVLFTVLLGLESLVFGMFTTVMLIDAFQMAASGDSQIDELGSHKGALERYPHQRKIAEMKENENRTCKLGLQEFCGSKPSVKWMVPVRGSDEEYFRGLTDSDRYVMSTTYWDRYVVPRARSVHAIEMATHETGTSYSDKANVVSVNEIVL